MGQAPELPLVSAVIPTFNSARTLSLTLESIRTQSYPPDRVEILVVDGGSTDQTRQLAAQFGATLLANPKVQQEHAKHIGLLAARGKYVLFIDSDEVLPEETAIATRVRVLESQPRLKIVLTGGYQKPPGSSCVNDYINTFCDPFAYFMYGVSADHRYYVASLRKHYRVEWEDPAVVVFVFGRESPLPLVDMCAGHLLNAEWLRQDLGPRLEEVAVIPRLFYWIVAAGSPVAVLKHSWVIHHSADSLLKFLRKIRWRVIANIHYPSIPGTGFLNREEFQPASFRYRKYLFLPYAFTLVGPLIESVSFAANRRMPVLLLHLPLTLYTAWLICWQQLRKLLGARPGLRSYGAEEAELRP